MDEKQRQEIANFRYGLIAPLVTRKLEPGEQAHLLKEIASHGYEIPYSTTKMVSVRTLERYTKAYREGGWDALKPSTRADQLRSKTIEPEVLEKAIALKKENTARSVRQIIAILELAKFVQLGELKESTLSKQLRRRGMTKKALENEHKDNFRRFEADHRNACWQGDVQHTLYLPHPEKKGKKKMAYLVVFIDDYARYVVHAQFYFEERVPRLEDCLKKAILKHGVPELIYVDNGAIYSSHHFARICGRLRTQLKHTRPGRPQGRGKQEKFFRFVDQSFVPEAYDLIEQGKIQTLADLNQFFTAWLEVAYHQKIHNSFKQRPVDRFRKCDYSIRTVPPHELMEVFLLEETRKVDKTNCISLMGTTYEVEPGLVGEKVQLRFDPYDMSVIQVWKDEKRLKDAVVMELRSMEWEKPKEAEKLDSQESTQKTGLNYIELVYEEYIDQQKQKQQEGFASLMKGGDPV
ncbi:DDE-type integrase/transposase/recombinase [Aquibacillus salsiterrae]|uniref:DDE-type integrase/transposase/recombinase n=1 Tax=Aquibacillus salsiterrae TaxID=2950439 RepID=A0A9X3WF57_9BACI|nr:DDE-type integrase/transposase/recombinase [Aquibacillus salsiterrae]MDC3418682.1 DDE-type integrase/transposase/recombinase [Aquibacillus salsiterrae]